MKLANCVTTSIYFLIAAANTFAAGQTVKEQVFNATNAVKIKLRMEGPYTADVPLQIVCYFKYTPQGAAKMRGAPSNSTTSWAA